MNGLNKSNMFMDAEPRKINQLYNSIYSLDIATSLFWITSRMQGHT